MPHWNLVKCPYYVTHRKGRGGWDYTVTCENIHNNMGFEMKTQLRFDSCEELTAYMDLFCCDFEYATCPYYQAVYRTNSGDSDNFHNITMKTPKMKKEPRAPKTPRAPKVQKEPKAQKAPKAQDIEQVEQTAQAGSGGKRKRKRSRD